MSGFFESIANLVNTLSKNACWYITQKWYEREVLEYPWFLPFVPDKYKTKKMCERAVGDYLWVFKFVPGKYKTKKICERAVGDYLWAFKFVPDKYKTIKMCEELLVIIYGYLNLFRISIRRRRYVKEPLKISRHPVICPEPS